MGCLMRSREEKQAGHVRTLQRPPNLSALERLLWQQGQATLEGRQGHSLTTYCVPGAGHCPRGHTHRGGPSLAGKGRAGGTEASSGNVTSGRGTEAGDTRGVCAVPSAWPHVGREGAGRRQGRAGVRPPQGGPTCVRLRGPTS